MNKKFPKIINIFIFKPYCFFLLSFILFWLCPIQKILGQQLPGCVPKEVASSKIIGDVPSSTRIHISISLPIRNEKERNLLHQQLHDRKSPRYGTVLTKKEFGESFAPLEPNWMTDAPLLWMPIRLSKSVINHIVGKFKTAKLILKTKPHQVELRLDFNKLGLWCEIRSGTKNWGRSVFKT